MTATAITSLGEVTEVPEKAKRRTYTAEYKLRDKRIAELERQLAKQTVRAERAEAIAEIQKKLAALFGRPFPNEES
jgi:hypothetical protein